MRGAGGQPLAPEGDGQAAPGPAACSPREAGDPAPARLPATAARAPPACPPAAVEEVSVCLSACLHKQPRRAR